MYDGVKFSFDEALLVENEDSLTINNAYEILSLDDITRNYNKYYNSNGCTLNLSLRDFLRLYPSVISEENEIILYDDICGALTCTVKSIDIAKYTVQIEFDASKYNDSASYIIVRAAGTYKAKAIDNGDYVLVNELGEEIRFAGYEDISATLDKDRIVACEFRTGVIDFASLRSKTLYKLAFTPTRETSGKISLGYTTNLSSVKKEREFANTFDFLAYDFNKFAFDGGFFKTYMRRVFERGFNYIMFEFASLGDGPFGIESAQAIYSVNNELRSDR